MLKKILPYLACVKFFYSMLKLQNGEFQAQILKNLDFLLRSLVTHHRYLDYIKTLEPVPPVYHAWPHLNELSHEIGSGHA
jgi:hypothetical protein